MNLPFVQSGVNWWGTHVNTASLFGEQVIDGNGNQNYCDGNFMSSCIFKTAVMTSFFSYKCIVGYHVKRAILVLEVPSYSA